MGIAQDFRLGEFTDREQVGRRRNLIPIEASAHAEGILLGFNQKLTSKEVRAILQCATDLGLLPGEVQEKDRVPDSDSMNRFDRV